ncbi:fumarylacetoacetate hydrolase family protein [Vibrio sp. F74]|uniref:fumarylacetoacetate hydrolase family protein n=1 Tax=Vibrio sp. F74 TaxID=700020 RepID=UPI0035F5E7A0
MNSNQLVKEKFVCVALNDAKQLNELNGTFSEKPYVKPPTQPVLYFKTRNTWSSDGAKVSYVGDSMVVGASIALVIGKTCCRVSETDALDYISGLTLTHDFSLPEQSYYRPDIKGKCLDGSAPIAQNPVPLSDIASLADLTVTTSVNGEEKSVLSVSQFHRSIEQLIHLISTIMTLNVGDVIAVGFPGDRIAVQVGDNVSSSMSGLQQLNNTLTGE